MGKLTWMVIRFYQIWSFFLLLFCLSDQPLLSVFPAAVLPAPCPHSLFPSPAPIGTAGQPQAVHPVRLAPGSPVSAATGLGGTALPLAEKPALTSLLSKWWPLAPRFFADLQLLFPALLSYGDVSAVSMSEEPRL